MHEASSAAEHIEQATLQELHCLVAVFPKVPFGQEVLHLV